VSLLSLVEGELCAYCHQEPAVVLRGGIRAVYCSTSCRKKSRRSNRSISIARQRAHAEQKLARATTPQEQVQALWDTLRALLRRLPPAQQREAYEAVTRLLTTTIASLDAQRGGSDV
jgi:hypothetical protein